MGLWLRVCTELSTRSHVSHQRALVLPLMRLQTSIRAKSTETQPNNGLRHTCFYVFLFKGTLSQSLLRRRRWVRHGESFLQTLAGSCGQAEPAVPQQHKHCREQANPK